MIIPLLLFFGLTCYLHDADARTIKVAVIDTGKSSDPNIKLCKNGHRDFTGKGIEDHYGHGTNVSMLINNASMSSDYCIIVIKVWENHTGEFDLVEIFNYVRSLKPDIINMSGGYVIPTEINKNKDSTYKAVENILNDGIIFVNSAGNNNINLDTNCVFFPACYDDRMVVVGNMLIDGTRHPRSNYGNLVIDRWEMGTNIVTNKYLWTGTSQAAAIATGKIVLNLQKMYNSKPNKEAK